MSLKRFAIKAALIIGLLLTLTFSFLPMLARTSNCGGNSAALSRCGSYSLTVAWKMEESSGDFKTGDLTDEERKEVLRLADNHWNPGSHLLLKRIVREKGDPKQIVVVCDKAYNNVPQPTVWNLYSKNPAHAVGYADRTTGLITPKQFRELDFKEFMDAHELVVSPSTENGAVKEKP